MKKFISVFVLILVSAVFSYTQSDARTTSWPPHLLSFTKPADGDGSTSNTSIASKIITGLASFYADRFEGSPTATGEIFNSSKFTAASNFFALNTWVKVTNLLTGKYIIVRINDRMHPRMAKQGRVVDLSLSAAKKLKIVGRGIAKVKVEAIPPTSK